MPKFNRRQALRSMVLGGSMAAFGGLSPLGTLLDAHAAPDPDNAVPERYYVFCYFSGAWDILLSLDPRDPAVFHNGNITTTRIQPAYDMLGYTTDPRVNPNIMGGNAMLDLMGEPVFFGPYMGELLSDPEITSRMVVVRGMSMDTLTHQVGRRRFLTGKQPSGLTARGSSTDTWLASKLAGKEPLPNLAIRMESYNKDLPAYASALRTSSANDLLRVLSPGDVQIEAIQEDQLEALLAQNASCADSQLSELAVQAEEARKKTKSMLEGNLDKLFDFGSNSTEMLALRDHFGFPSNYNSASAEVQAAVAATALTRGVSRCVSIEVARGLDTHFDNWITDQGSRQEAGFNVVARLAKYLAKTPYMKDGKEDGSWLDRTVIVGFSEFSRTPLINNRSGRDHWLGNSAFLIGGGLKGGRIIGNSSDFGMYPTAIDLKTGMPDPDGEIVRPEHIIRALYDEVGISKDPDLRVDGLTALFG